MSTTTTRTLALVWYELQRPARTHYHRCVRQLRLADSVRRALGLRPRWWV